MKCREASCGMQANLGFRIGHPPRLVLETSYDGLKSAHAEIPEPSRLLSCESFVARPDSLNYWNNFMLGEALQLLSFRRFLCFPRNFRFALPVHQDFSRCQHCPFFGRNRFIK